MLLAVRENSKRLATPQAVDRKVRPIGRENVRAAQFFAQCDECRVGVVHRHIGVLLEGHTHTSQRVGTRRHEQGATGQKEPHARRRQRLPEAGPIRSIPPELEKFIDGKVESGLYNNASEVIREGLRLLKEHDEVRLKWREQIEQAWLQAQAGTLVDGPKTMATIRDRLKSRGKKRA